MPCTRAQILSYLICSGNTSPDTCRISLAFFPNCSILLAQKGSSSSSSLSVSTDKLQIVAGKLISLRLHNFTLKLKMNPFICLFLNSSFFRKLHDFLLHTDTPGAVLPTMTGCLQSLIEMILTQILLHFGETSSTHSPVQLSSFCQNFTLSQLLCSDHWLAVGARSYYIFSSICLTR